MIKLQIATFLSLCFFSQTINNYVVSSQPALSLGFPKLSPPLAIFEDEKIVIEKAVEEVITTNSIVTKLTRDLSKQAQELAKSFSEQQVVESSKIELAQENLIGEIPAEVRTIKLQGLKLQKTNPNISTIIKSLPRKPDAQFKLPSTNQARFVPDVTKSAQDQFEEIKQQFIGASDINQYPDLSYAQRVRLESVKNLKQLEIQDWSQPSWQEKASELITQETIEPTQTIEQKQLAALEKAWGWPASGRPINPAISSPTKWETKKPDVIAYNPPPRENSNLLAEAAPKKKIEKQLLISGPVEMTAGMAFLGSEQTLRVYRLVGGLNQEEANVLINEGKYEIFLTNPENGILVGEVIDARGSVLGRGQISLSEVVNNYQNKEDLKKVAIKISPIASRVATQTVSGYSYMKDEIVAGAKVSVNGAWDLGKTDKNGSVDFQLLSDSNMLVKTEKTGYWGSLTFKAATDKFKQMLFGERTVQAWFDQLNIVDHNIKDKGIIWGEVKINKMTVSDAEVELISSESVARATYFLSSVIPDASLKSTTASGRFAFFGIEPGIYIVKAKYQGKSLPSQVVAVDRGLISEVTLQSQSKVPSEIYVYDLETSAPLASNINIIGSDKSAYSSTGRHVINFAGTEGIQIIEATPLSKDYFVSRTTVNKTSKQTLVPVISYGWINQLLATTRTNQNTEKSVIIGFTQKPKLTVELDPAGITDDTEIFYLNAKGEVLLGSTEAPQGGGFIIINAATGVRSLMLKYAMMNQSQIHTVIAEPNIINVFNPTF